MWRTWHCLCRKSIQRDTIQYNTTQHTQKNTRPAVLGADQTGAEQESRHHPRPDGMRVQVRDLTITNSREFFSSPLYYHSMGKLDNLTHLLYYTIQPYINHITSYPYPYNLSTIHHQDHCSLSGPSSPICNDHNPGRTLLEP